MLKIQDLRKYFPIRRGFFKQAVGYVKAVDGVTLSVDRGEAVGIVGESGCGKSTLVRCAIRLIEPTDGQILFDGQDLCALSKGELRHWRSRVQMVFQDPYSSLNPRKTVRANIGDALIAHARARAAAELRDRVASALELVGLSPDVMNRYPHQFSGGQQQRICIARAIALEPHLLVCDEAVSALDVSVQAQILNLLNELKSRLNLGLLFISHDLHVVRYLCDRLLVIYKGRVVESAATEELFAQPQHPYTNRLLGATCVDHPLKRSPAMEGRVSVDE